MTYKYLWNNLLLIIIIQFYCVLFYIVKQYENKIVLTCYYYCHHCTGACKFICTTSSTCNSQNKDQFCYCFVLENRDAFIFISIWRHLSHVYFQYVSTLLRFPLPCKYHSCLSYTFGMNVTIVGLLRIKFIDCHFLSNSPNTLVLNDTPAIGNDCMTVWLYV